MKNSTKRPVAFAWAYECNAGRRYVINGGGSGKWGNGRGHADVTESLWNATQFRNEEEAGEALGAFSGWIIAELELVPVYAEDEYKHRVSEPIQRHQIVEALDREIARITALRDLCQANVEALEGFHVLEPLFTQWPFQIFRVHDHEGTTEQARRLCRLLGSEWEKDTCCPGEWSGVIALPDANIPIVIHRADVEAEEKKKTVPVEL